VQDASSAAFYGGASTTIYSVLTGTTIAVAVTAGGSNTATQYTAGTAAYTVTATVAAGSTVETGLPINWSDAGTAATSSFTPASGTTASVGTTSSTFQPDNTAGDTAVVTATLGTASTPSPGTAATITTVAGAPTSIAFNSPYSKANHYLTSSTFALNGKTRSAPYATIAANSITVSATDAFGNAVSFSSGWTSLNITVAALSAGGLFNTASNTNRTAIDCGPSSQVSCSTGTVALLYAQSGTYGSSGLISATVTGKFNGVSVGSLSGTTGNLITGTFAGASPVPTTSATSVVAGGTVKVTATLGTLQANVPVTLYIDEETSYEATAGDESYAGAGAPGMSGVTGSGSTLGVFTATFNVDNTLGANGFWNSTIASPTDSKPGNYLATSADSVSAVVTTAGPASGLLIIATYDTVFADTAKGALASGTIYVNVKLVDAYGNTAANPGPNVIQVNLATSAGTISSSLININSGSKDTNGAVGPIAWTMPSSGTSNTLTATAVISGSTATTTKTLSIVTKNTAIQVKLPTATSGVIYANGAVVFSGNAQVSYGYDPTVVTLSSVNYKVDSGTFTSITPTRVSGANYSWSQAIVMSAGLHTVVLGATDSKSNIAATNATEKVLVDFTAPTITATTAANAQLSSGSAVVFSVVDSEGDLNAAALTASFNGTGTLTASVTSGTNNPGSSVTYTVSVSGLPTSTGHWGVTLTAKDLAGNSATSSTLVVKVLALTGVSSFSSTAGASSSTSGGFTGASIAFTNNEGQSATVNVFFVWYNSANQVVSVGAQLNVAFAIGQSQSFFNSYQTHGTYTVKVFIQDTSGNALSTSYSATVSV